MIFAAVSAASQAQPRPTEFQVEAAYLYNFGKFVRWPDNSGPSPQSPFLLCVMGRDPFQGALDAVISGQTIGGAPVAVKKVVDLNGLSGCRILYVNREDVGRFRSALDIAHHLPIVTVSEAPDFLKQGGIIQFVLVGDRIRFAVNLTAAHNAGIELSAELLKVATRVVGENSTGQVRP